MPNEVKHPEVKVKLVGRDGNAFTIIGSVSDALKKAKVPREEIDAFHAEAMSGDYDDLLVTCMKWVSVE